MWILWTLDLGGAGPVLVSYVDPTRVTVIDEPASDAGIDPTKVTVIQ